MGRKYRQTERFMKELYELLNDKYKMFGTIQMRSSDIVNDKYLLQDEEPDSYGILSYQWVKVPTTQWELVVQILTLEGIRWARVRAEEKEDKFRVTTTNTDIYFYRSRSTERFVVRYLDNLLEPVMMSPPQKLIGI